MKSLNFFENHPFIDGHRSWPKFIHNSLQNLNLTTCSLILNKISQLLTDQQCLIDFSY